MLPPVISSGPESQMKVGSFHACVWYLTEQASLPPPCELRALPSHLGSSAEEKTDSMLGMPWTFTKHTPKGRFIWQLENKKTQQQPLSLRKLIVSILGVNVSEKNSWMSFTCYWEITKKISSWEVPKEPQYNQQRTVVMTPLWSPRMKWHSTAELSQLTTAVTSPLPSPPALLSPLPGM